MKKIVLFDMDGTLTPPRQKMNMNMEIMLRKLQEQGFDIGIITGSDMNYIKQQCSNLFDLSLTDTSKIHFLPCNGTKYYYNDEEKYSNNMKSYMGSKSWNKLLCFLISKQNEIANKNSMHMPLSGHFFDYRGSTLNWCPIGRNATPEDRKVWEFMDKNNFIRNPLLKEIREYVEHNINFVGDTVASNMLLTIKLGGDTSFDIFPKGWDKTYVLNQTDLLSDYEEIHFIGDRCKPNGNDYEIFIHPKTIGKETSSTEETIQILNKILGLNV